MDSQAIGPVGKAATQVSNKVNSFENRVPSGGSNAGAQTDTVSLSQRGQAAVSQQVRSNSSFNGSGSELRKIDVTDDNEVIVKVVDSETQKVVRQIPKEEEMRLRQAIQKNLDNLSDSANNGRLDTIA